MREGGRASPGILVAWALIGLGLAAFLVASPFPGLHRIQAMGWFALARAYEARGDTRSALRAYASAEGNGMKTADFYARWGALEEKERLGIQAEQHMLAAIDLEPGHAAAHEMLAGLYFERGSYDQAGQEYAIAAGLIPRRAAELYMRAGEACEEGGNRERAAAMFGRALAARPNFAPAESGLARVHRPSAPAQRVKMFPPLGGNP